MPNTPQPPPKPDPSTEPTLPEPTLPEPTTIPEELPLENPEKTHVDLPDQKPELDPRRTVARER